VLGGIKLGELEDLAGSEFPLERLDGRCGIRNSWARVDDPDATT
jgi:hypothetical protein